MVQEIKEQILSYLARENYRPLELSALGEALAVTDWHAYLQAIKELSENYLIGKTKKGKYVLAEQAGVMRGVYLARSRDFGFVTVEADIDDIFVGRREAKGAMDGDTVLVALERESKKHRNRHRSREGVVLKILQRAHKTVVGTVYEDHGVVYLYPDDKRLYYPVILTGKGAHKVKRGYKAAAEITEYPKRGQLATARLLQVLGAADEPGVDMETLLWQYDLPVEFSEEALASARALPQQVDVAAAAGRTDRRNLPVVTIDGSDTRDIDDGVYCEKTEDGWFLSVHIADVAEYVRGGSALDREAYERGTSVYFPGSVLPLLPRELSNGICSLNAGVDRLALSCDMYIGKRGAVHSYNIYESVIRVAQRLDYDTVNAALLDGDKEARKKLLKVLPQLEALAELQNVLEKKRVRRGALNFEFPETKVAVDPDSGKVIDVYRRQSRLAEKMIEEAMIVTNETVAGEFFRRGVPFIYRVHKAPTAAKLAALAEVVAPLGYEVDRYEEFTAKRAQDLLRECSGKPEEVLVQTVLLRSMSHAFYDTNALGHFALASKYYSHFTSPIRRYADLSIHRVIKSCLHHRIPDESKAEMRGVLSLAAMQASAREQVAEEAERAAVKAKCCQYMQNQIGKVFNGHISGVQHYGIYVELDNTIEGLVHVDNLSVAEYNFIANAYMLRGSDGSRYRLGDAVKVRVLQVNVQDGEIDFELA